MKSALLKHPFASLLVFFAVVLLPLAAILPGCHRDKLVHSPDASSSDSAHYAFYVHADSSLVAFWAPVSGDTLLDSSIFIPGTSGTDSLWVTFSGNDYPYHDSALTYLYRIGDKSQPATFSTGSNGIVKSDSLYASLSVTGSGTYQGKIRYRYGAKHDPDSIPSLFSTSYVVAPTSMHLKQAFCLVNLNTYSTDIVDSISFTPGNGAVPDTFTVYVSTLVNLDNPPDNLPLTKQIKCSQRIQLPASSVSNNSLITQTVVTYTDSKQKPKKKTIPTSVPIKSYDDPSGCL